MKKLLLAVLSIAFVAPSLVQAAPKGKAHGYEHGVHKKAKHKRVHY